ncbi:hypothetical protein DPM19_05850 [Actinomadura craniellae]|uniref:DUF4132 domain-containing protein n=1 Tax=Actinomadura craniellae TaxID=2231787 RepID=A0A365HBB8_9ACTN|nr:DUF4132 domain-containing protein [Actinomadura craniellae]RAY16397.1 hypothetical protein DPM19_05850 [Actinomadura craniellae]
MPQKNAPPVAESTGERVWIPAADGYELALDGSTLVCRNAKGRELKSVPKKARDSEAAEHLYALRDWLVRHETDCRATVESWMLGSFPVPRNVLVEIWPDPAWRVPLENLAVVGADGSAGLLRDVDAKGRLGIVDLDAETRWLEPDSVLIPHPVLLDDLDDLREFAVELGVRQTVPQLAREVHRRPAGLDGTARRLDSYGGGEFKELRHATARATRFGFQVRGGYAVCRAYDAGVPVQARYWVGSDTPDAPAWTGDLIWVDADERALPLSDVGPVAWSEGVRLAELIYAGRVAEEGEETP